MMACSYWIGGDCAYLVYSLLPPLTAQSHLDRLVHEARRHDDAVHLLGRPSQTGGNFRRHRGRRCWCLCLPPRLSSVNSEFSLDFFFISFLGGLELSGQELACESFRRVSRVRGRSWMHPEFGGSLEIYLGVVAYR